MDDESSDDDNKAAVVSRGYEDMDDICQNK
jgi:hypothetical protein